MKPAENLNDTGFWALVVMEDLEQKEKKSKKKTQPTNDDDNGIHGNQSKVFLQIDPECKN